MTDTTDAHPEADAIQGAERPSDASGMTPRRRGVERV